MPRPPLPGALGREIQAKVCVDCWGEWTRTEVMVINELRLNFMDSASQQVLDRHLREFLHLPPALPHLPNDPAGSTETAGTTSSVRRAEPAGPGKPSGPGSEDRSEPGDPSNPSK